MFAHHTYHLATYNIYIHKKKGAIPHIPYSENSEYREKLIPYDIHCFYCLSQLWFMSVMVLDSNIVFDLRQSDLK